MTLDLRDVEKPARYIGGEVNMVVKDAKSVCMRFALCFPDVYEVGMSHLGLSILYFFMNRRDDVYCERAFAPWIDMEARMRESHSALTSLETDEPLKAFDFVGFTLQYEMSYTNVINMLDLAGIPIFSKDRTDDDPLICAGGPCAYNPEPLADFIDFFYIGEGEAALDSVFDGYKAHKASGKSRREFLTSALCDIPCVYTPSLYQAQYKDNGEIEAFFSMDGQARKITRKAFAPDADSLFFPEKPLVPLIEVVHDRAALELFRGCVRGCRFCQAGYIYRPPREKKPDTLLNQARAIISNTGYDEISLLSLSASDYSGFNELADKLFDDFADKKVNISLPSLRVDAVSLDIMTKAQGVRKSSLTFAPEAGSQRLRDVANKGVTEEDALNGVGLAFEHGWSKVKLYFMIGLPTETEDDVADIIRLADKITKLYKKKSPPLRVNVSVSCFVPKPFTPFQWESQNSADMFSDKQLFLKSLKRDKRISLSYHDPFVSVVEGVLARGDRRVGGTIFTAWKLGARFDGWSELFKREVWKTALAGSEEFYTLRARSVEEILPWDHIDVGVRKSHLITEREKAYDERLTPNCREACSMCGARELAGGTCIV